MARNVHRWCYPLDGSGRRAYESSGPTCCRQHGPEMLWAGLHGEREEARGVWLQLHGLTVLWAQMVKLQRKVPLEMGQDFQMRVKSILECSCRLPQLSKPGSGPWDPLLLLERRGSGTQ